MLYKNNAAIGNFETTGSYYWSSSEAVTNAAWRQRFSDGYQGYNAKYTTYAVRCARR